MTSNRVDKVLVTSGTQAASVAALTARQYTVEVKGKANNSVLEADDEFRIAVKAPNGKVLFGDWIKAKNIKAINKEAAAAKVEQVITITPGTLEANTEYNLALVDVSERQVFSYRQYKRVYTVLTGSTVTLTAVLADLASQINRDPAATVTATSTATTLVLTAKSQQDVQDRAGIFGRQVITKASFYKVETFGSQSVSQGTVVTTTAPVFGQGQGYQVRALEDGQTGYQGYFNRLLFPVDQYPYGSVTSEAYTLYVIEDIDEHSTNSTVLNLTDAPRTNIIATVSDTALALIFADLLA